MNLKLIVTDMDGTFLRPTHTYDRKLFRALFEEIKKEEVEFVVASGGVYARIGSVFDEDIRRQINFITDNGSVLRKGDEIIQVIGFNQDQYMEIINLLENIPDIRFYISTVDQTYGLLKRPWYERLIEKTVMALVGDRRIYLEDFGQIPSRLLASKIGVQAKNSQERINEIRTQIEKTNIPAQVLTSGSNSIDIIPAQSGKGQAVRFFQDKYNFTKDETISFGDAMNDASMMDESGYRVAMANCDPDLLAYCTHQIGSSKKQSMQKLLYELFKIKDLSLLDRYKIK